jgi:hypothetical protein
MKVLNPKLQIEYKNIIKPKFKIYLTYTNKETLEPEKRLLCKNKYDNKLQMYKTIVYTAQDVFGSSMNIDNIPVVMFDANDVAESETIEGIKSRIERSEGYGYGMTVNI